MASLLRQLVRRALPTATYASRLLAAFPRTEGRKLRTESAEAPHSVLRPQPSTLVEPLTGREREVLRWLAAGSTNAAIARELVVAVGTVKRHVNSVFGKLRAQNRVAAAARARNLGLL